MSFFWFSKNSGLKCDQFKCANCCVLCAYCVGCCACCAGCCACGTGCVDCCTCWTGCGWAGGSEGAGISSVCGPASAILCFNFTVPCYSIFYSVKLSPYSYCFYFVFYL